MIGVGNVYRRDDGAGPEVAARVRQLAPPGVVVREHDGDPADLLDLWDGAAMAVVIDAVHTHAAAPGKVYRVEVDDGPGGLPTPRPASSHGLGPGDAVALARALDRLPGRLVIYGIEADHFEQGVGLSPEVAAAVDEVVGEVLRELGELAAGESSEMSRRPR